MLRAYHRRTVLSLIVILILFALLFMLALVHLRRNQGVFGIGLPYHIEDALIMVLSVAAMARVAYALVRIEHHRELG
jgi:hypothetical protein